MDNLLILSLGLFVLGLLFTAVEVVVPSGGLLGLIALLSLLGSLVAAYQVTPWTAIVMAGIEAISVPFVIFMAFKVLPKTKLGQGLFLKPPQQNRSWKANPSDSATSPFEYLIGREGVVVSGLRPSGTADFEGRRVSVVSSGETIEANHRVRVILVEGNRVVVECMPTESML